jgi:hypothetical protein
MTIPGSQVREALGRQTVRFRVARLRRITARPFGLTTADREPFCAGWASFMEDLSERLYGQPRPSLT